MEGDYGGAPSEDEPVEEWDTPFIQALGDHRFADALVILLRQDAPSIRAKCWDLLTLYFASIDEYEVLRAAEEPASTQTNSEISNDQIFGDLLQNLSRHMTPKDLLMVYVDVIRRTRSLPLFVRQVEAITENLHAIERFNTATFLWCVQVVGRCMDKVTAPRMDNLEAEERMLMDASTEVTAIVGRCRALVDFLEINLTFVQNKHSLGVFSSRDRLQICASTVKHLGSTLGLLDLSQPREGRSASEQHALSVRLVHKLNSIADPIRVLHLSDSMRPRMEEDEQDELAIPVLSAAVFSYVVFCLSQDFPRLYAPTLISDLILNFSLILVTSSHSMHIVKGLSLIDSPLVHYMEQSIASEDEVFTVRRLLKSLLQVMTSCPLKEARDRAMVCWKQVFNRCEGEIRPKLLISLIRAIDQPSVIGFLIDELRRQFSPTDDTALRGQIENSICDVVYLPDGETTDLLDNSEHILSALNFLRFGLEKRCLPKSAHVDKYLDDLKKGLQLSRAHYKLQLEMPEADRAKTVSLLPDIPPQMEKDVLSQALTRFDLLEFVLGQVQTLYDKIK